MKIAFHRKRVLLQDLEAAQLKRRLPAHTVIDWYEGDEAAVRDFEVLIVVDALDRRLIESQPRLFFVLRRLLI